VELLFILVIGLFLYFLPWLISSSRQHHNQSGIFILNLLIGWTFIGWIVALVMACGEVKHTAAAPPDPQT
jgi:hypothetical protein